jgi:(p)ppGpp synthase/HD superfamily hydrolase
MPAFTSRAALRFEEALAFAARLHANQTRKGGAVPYVAHLLGVTAIALEHGAGEDAAIAALLHDAVEDQGGAATREEIRRRFGDAVAAIVDGCTDSDAADPERKPPWEQRKKTYLDHLRTAPPDVRLVSAADKLHNARSILADLRERGEEAWKIFKGGKKGTRWYYGSLVTIFRETGTVPALTEELARTVAEIERLAGPENP